MTKDKKMINKLPIYWGYMDGFRSVQVRSLGHKWVWLREGPFTGPHQRLFRKIKRSHWDKCKMITLEEFRWQSTVRKYANENDLNIISCRKVKSHPTKKFGWRFRTFEELEEIYLEKINKQEKSA